jgi:hypothetical protein
MGLSSSNAAADPTVVLDTVPAYGIIPGANRMIAMINPQTASLEGCVFSLGYMVVHFLSE